MLMNWRGLDAGVCGRWRNNSLGLLFTLALTVGLVAGGSLAFFGIGGALILYGLSVIEHRGFLRPSPIIMGFGLVFLALVVLSDITAFAPARSWAMSARLVTIVLPLMLLFLPDGFGQVQMPAWVARWLPWLMLGIMSLLLLEFYADGQIFLPYLHGKDERLVYYNRGLSYAAVLIWPLVALLRHAGRGRLACMLVVALLVVVWFSTSRGALVALLGGIGFFVVASLSVRLVLGLGVVLLAVVALGVLVFVPWVFDHHLTWFASLPSSWYHRVEIWDYMLAWHGLQPWLGAGVDGAGLVPLTSPHQHLYMHALAPAAHPHQMYLQLVLELGPLGWLWGVAVAGWSLWKVGHWRVVSVRAEAFAVWAALLVLACGSFSLWSDSFWSAGALAWLFCATQRNRKDMLSSGALA